MSDTPLKRGFTQDGKVYWGKSPRSGAEVWLSEEKFKQKQDYQLNYLRVYSAAKCREQAELRRSTTPQVGDTREDGRVYVGWSRGYKDDNWVSPEEFTTIHSDTSKVKTAHPSLKNGTLTRGHQRADGKLFWQYVKRKSGVMYEKYVTPEQYEKSVRQYKEYRKDMEKPDNLPARGYVREDGLVFAGFCRQSKGMQQWVTQEQFDEAKRRRRNRHKIAYRNCPVFSQEQRWRATINGILRSFREGKNPQSRIVSILGCNLEVFKVHVENQFTEGMTWCDYGTWEIDHRTPCDSAKTVEHLRILFHYTNLQPLWREENIKKGSKI